MIPHPVVRLQQRLDASPSLRDVTHWPEWDATIQWCVDKTAEVRALQAKIQELLPRRGLEVVK